MSWFLSSIVVEKSSQSIFLLFGINVVSGFHLLLIIYAFNILAHAMFVLRLNIYVYIFASYLEFDNVTGSKCFEMGSLV